MLVSIYHSRSIYSGTLRQLLVFVVPLRFPEYMPLFCNMRWQQLHLLSKTSVAFLSFWSHMLCSMKFTVLEEQLLYVMLLPLSR